MRSGIARLALALGLVAAPAAAQQPVIALPFHSPANLIVVQATVGGSRPLWFILDTGAQRSSIDSRLADSLGLQLGGAGRTTGAAASTPTRWIPSMTVRLGGVDLALDSAFTMPHAPLEPGLGHPVDGILGHEVLAPFVVDIDYDADSIRFYRPEDYRPHPDARAVPLRVADNMAVVDAELAVAGERIAASLLLDTGASAEMVLGRHYVQRHALLRRAREVAPVNGGMGVGGSPTTSRGVLEAVHVAGFALARPNAMLLMDSVGALAEMSAAGVAGVMGAEVFRRFHVTLDYPHRRMLLRPGAALNQPFARGRSGIALVAPGPEYGRYQVASVLPRSPGEAAGVRAGDIVVAVDGRTPATLDALRDLLRVPAARLTLTVRRGANTVELPITLEGA
ncbi:MAG TPA: aspartyl protease family protein [Longimicrobium sp.]|jgi:hypothetical protein|uniref:aspartyl protease family protein n=1 Tax=Longimicrobium sp. TaxID=2029185 RepID=UPI002ED8A455